MKIAMLGGKMKIAIIGHGRAGKDTVANWLGEHTTLRYRESTSQAATALCYQQMQEKYRYISMEDAFQDRHNHREEWASIIYAHNKPDGLTLYRGMLEEGDILNGMRREAELEALRTNLMIDLTIWIDRDVPADPSNEMTCDAADFIIDNNSTLKALYTKLTRLTRWLRILR